MTYVFSIHEYNSIDNVKKRINNCVKNIHYIVEFMKSRKEVFERQSGKICQYARGSYVSKSKEQDCILTIHYHKKSGEYKIILTATQYFVDRDQTCIFLYYDDYNQAWSLEEVLTSDNDNISTEKWAVNTFMQNKILIQSRDFFRCGSRNSVIDFLDKPDLFKGEYSFELSCR